MTGKNKMPAHNSHTYLVFAGDTQTKNTKRVFLPPDEKEKKIFCQKQASVRSESGLLRYR